MRILSYLTVFTLSASFLIAQEDDSIFQGQSPTIDERMIEEIKNSPLNVQVGATFMVANPQDSLRNAIMRFDSPSVGYGFGLSAAYAFDPAPFVVGAEFALNFYGGRTEDYYVRNGPFLDTLRYSAMNMQMPITTHVRVQPNLFTWVFPYVEGNLGMMVFTSSLDITRNPDSDTPKRDDQSEASVSWLYGGGAGVMVKFADIITLPSTLQRMLLDIRFRYLRGTSVDLPSVKFSDDQTVVRDSAHVPDPSFVFFNIGLAVQF
jgi:hypothetical protein